ncbi:hypothetical protein GCM10010112_13700 [Actinoplanes lobatus]|uniref:Uncharacterized protein n=1 Tax=Actinoplanes lobatus TaxID=113568 RepID=A0A7W7HME5_9ACTN|nr:hypothetical protein [Actinoplanes lobatus]MBB4753207.1 hypothetical protein [Actinoplanes lobatus]GGN59120.1 hypothetical protein GCM10010112_13700 [Actinoplanes lobatus]GIE42933.1 hypothetical protein Alo02nite_58310 [Actinoplanes lobatus]
MTVPIDLARELLPRLGLLVNHAEATRLNDAIEQLLREHDNGVDVDTRLVELFSSVPEIQRYVANTLTDPHIPQKTPYEPLAGDRAGSSLQRYECPYGPHTTWFRTSLSQEIPLCAEHQIPLRLVPGR